MKNIGYYNGKYGLIEEMSVPMNDRGCYFGDGIYEAAIGAEHRPFALSAHIDRCFRSAEKIRLELPFTKERLADTILEMAQKVDDGNQLVYWQFTRGTAPRSHIFPKNCTANLWIYIRPFNISTHKDRIKLITLEDTRFLHCDIKTINLLPSVMYAEQAEEAGCGEAVLHRGERVTECAHSNVHFLKNGEFFTPPADNLILPGITRAQLIQLCEGYGIPVHEIPFTLDELLSADEVLVSSSTKLCVAASEVDGRPVGGRAPELVSRLQDGLSAMFRAETGYTGP